MTKAEEIRKAVTEELVSEGHEATEENIYWAMTGLIDGWQEDKSDDCLEKSLYVLAGRAELMRISIKLTKEQLTF